MAVAERPTSPEVAEIEFNEMRQQIADQAAELERLDRKATALITPLGLLIGLAINSKANVAKPALPDALFYIGLAVLLAALVSGVRTIWPRSFLRVIPDPAPIPTTRSASVGATAVSDTRWRRWVFRLGERLRTVGESPMARRRIEQYTYQFQPGWAHPTALETRIALTEEWAAAWRANDQKAAGKVRWLRLEFIFMLFGTGALAAWYVLRAVL
jgi:hypothetical protein